MNNLKKISKFIITQARMPIAQYRTKKYVHNTPPPYNVHIGAGNTVFKNWINTDIGWKATHWLDVTKPWPFPKETVKYVYADNVIEHLPISSARLFFSHAHQVMQGNGVIRLATPDIGALVALYTADSQATTWHLQQASESGYQANHRVDLLRIAIQECGHHVGQPWDFDALRTELEAAGFTNVSRESHRKSAHAALANLEMRPEDNTPQSIDLVVEAVKPCPQPVPAVGTC